MSWLATLGLEAMGGLALMFGVMYLAAGLRWNDLRDVLLNRAYRSFTHEGEPIPGRTAGRVATTTIRLLASGDDGRRALLEQPRRP